MRLVLLDAGVVLRSDVLMDIKVEERPALATRLGRDEVVEAEVVGDYEVLFHVHQRAHRGRPAMLLESGLCTHQTTAAHWSLR